MCEENLAMRSSLNVFTLELCESIYLTPHSNGGTSRLELYIRVPSQIIYVYLHQDSLAYDIKKLRPDHVTKYR